ncbi:hypothetical protein ACH0B5_06100 [Ureibacillus sp. 179-F W5.1 NHS]|uniref:hypothetical protein n=1 Tax=Ureibacillus sp. 179-F W5.1 NHS TaxID=3374297 RepID=UPI0038790397
MNNFEYDRMKSLILENSELKQQLIKALEEKEQIIYMAEKALAEKKVITKRYENLKNSKLGKLTIWYWKKRGSK